MAVNPYNRYQEQAVSTMSSGDVLIKLFDKAVGQLQAAAIGIEQKDMDQAQPCMDRAQEIVRYLRQTLNMSIPISQQLDSLYVYFDQQIMMASIKRDVTLLQEVAGMLSELRDSFEQADRNTRHQGGVASLGEQGLSGSC